MQRDHQTYLYDVVQSYERIRQFTQGMTIEDYTTNILVKSAVERQFTIVGEALNRLKRLDEASYVQIPHTHQINGFRNIIVHGYDIVSDQLVWEIIKEHLDALESTCRRLLRAAEPESE